MPSPFENELVAGSPTRSLLPLTHGTTLEHLSAIVASTMGHSAGVIEVQLCDVFKKNLIYTFYGRPAYMKGGNEYTNDPAGLPVFLVLDGTLIDRSVMMYPFDTGRYHHYPFSADWSRDDFALRAARVSIDRVIRNFYDADKNYYWIEPKILTLSSGVSPL